MKNKEITLKDIKWERIENPEPGGPYWQPVNPYARFFWKQLITLYLHNQKEKEYMRENFPKLIDYFSNRIKELEK